MKVVFVIDLIDGRVVRGYKGERESYKPIHHFSKIVKSSNPYEVIKKLKPKYLYIADLDRIMGKGSNLEIILELRKEVEETMADCGFKEPNDVVYDVYPILGTETFNIKRLEEVDAKRVYVSLDLKEEELLDASNSFRNWIDAMEFLNSFNLKGVIVLMLDKVGTSTSLDFESLEMAVGLSDNPVYGGGGIRDTEDLIKAKEVGCDGVLISTAIHNGRIPIDVIRGGILK
ncbi:HisA/HisF family protein [Archaeoglobales archaeon]|nr:MAG: HisA/HisF family protein [Archaeoglobales archaeon]